MPVRRALVGVRHAEHEVRLDRWRYITEVRAQTCAQQLIPDEDDRKRVMFDLVQMAGGPPDPKVKPKLEAALERFVPDQVKRAEANPMIRANPTVSITGPMSLRTTTPIAVGRTAAIIMAMMPPRDVPMMAT